MLLCALPSENDSDYKNHEFWNNVDIYDCSDLNIRNRRAKDKQIIKQTNKKIYKTFTKYIENIIDKNLKKLIYNLLLI